MNVAVLAGGAGSRFPEETDVKPKPMIEIGGVPILWHILRYYAAWEYKEFVVALGYKGQVIKQFAREQLELRGDLRVDEGGRRSPPIEPTADDWTPELIETAGAT
jgi:glucose-1-phosphate cytidylyltransferase